MYIAKVLIIRKIDFISSFTTNIYFHFLWQLNNILYIRPFNYSQTDLIWFVHDSLELIWTHFNNYAMKQSSFLCDSNKSSTTTSQIFNVIFSSIILNLRMKSWYTFINNMNLIFRMSSNSSAVLLQWKTRSQRWLTLFYYELIYLLFVLWLSLRSLSFSGFDLFNLIN